MPSTSMPSPKPATIAIRDADQPTSSLEALTIELSIDSETLDRSGFIAAVCEAVESLEAEFLFDLPASGLYEDCARIAVIRLTPEGRTDTILFIKLSSDAQTISVAEPDAQTSGLAAFARAFVDVLTRL